jgi:hypothetical protein
VLGLDRLVFDFQKFIEYKFIQLIHITFQISSSNL